MTACARNKSMSKSSPPPAIIPPFAGIIVSRLPGSLHICLSSSNQCTCFHSCSFKVVAWPHFQFLGMGRSNSLQNFLRSLSLCSWDISNLPVCSSTIHALPRVLPRRRFLWWLRGTLPVSIQLLHPPHQLAIRPTQPPTSHR